MWPPVDTDGSLIRGFKCAFVVFEKASGCRAVTAALEKNATEEPLVLSTQERPVATGLKKWKREYNARYMLTEHCSANKLFFTTLDSKPWVESDKKERQNSGVRILELYSRY